jgi:outer membrane protein TolC
MIGRIAAAAGIGLLTILAAFPAHAQTDSCWSLEQCLRAAVETSPRLQASAQTARAAAAAAREASANRWPTLGVSGSFAYTSETQQIDIPAPPIPNYTPPKIRFYNDNLYDLAVNARIPIYAGGALWERMHAEAFGRQAAAFDLRSDSLQLAHDVRRAYFNALGCQARADAARLRVNRLERHLQELTSALSVGTASEESRLMALSKLRQAEQAVLTAEAEATAARLSLGNLVGQPEREIHPASDLNAPLADSSLSPLPVESRADVSATQARIEQNRRLALAARGALLPSLSGSATYHYGKPGVNMTENQWMDYYTLALTASWTLWDWQGRAQRVSQSRAASHAVEERRTDLVNALNTHYRTALSTLHTAQAAQTKAAERTDIERRRLDLVEGRMRQGLASESEYLDISDDLAAAETDLVSATTQLRLAEADLLSAAGY